MRREEGKKRFISVKSLGGETPTVHVEEEKKRRRGKKNLLACSSSGSRSIIAATVHALTCAAAKQC